jgi:hypothetical protein
LKGSYLQATPKQPEKITHLRDASCALNSGSWALRTCSLPRNTGTPLYLKGKYSGTFRDPWKLSLISEARAHSLLLTFKIAKKTPHTARVVAKLHIYPGLRLAFIKPLCGPGAVVFGVELCKEGGRYAFYRLRLLWCQVINPPARRGFPEEHPRSFLPLGDILPGVLLHHST